MRNRVNKNIAESIKSFLADSIASYEPRLNYELTSFETDDVLELLNTCITEWKTNYLFSVTMIKGKLSMEILGKNDLEDILLESSKGQVISIIDPVTSNGITFDIDSEDCQSFLVTGWGLYENIPNRFINKMPQGKLFRGN